MQMAMDAATLVIDGVDIYACTDDFKLNELVSQYYNLVSVK